MEGKSSLFDDMMTEQMQSDFQDLQAPMQFDHRSFSPVYQQSYWFQPQTESVLPVDYTQVQVVSSVNYKDNDRGVSLVSNDYASNCAVTSVDGHVEVDGHIEVDEERETQWQRIKWDEKMVRLLITAAAYIMQFASAQTGNWIIESSLLRPKLGKWKFISKLLVERGYHASPQQCEDKFNCLNKRYRRLNDILGKGTSCKVVENPELLDEMDISDYEKEIVKKLLSSKQLFYKEMCSYHNGNRLFLLYDPELEWSVHLTLSKKYESHSKWSNANDEQEWNAIAGQDNEIENEDTEGMLEFPNIPLMMSEKCNDLSVSQEGDEMRKQSMAFQSRRLRLKGLQLKAQLLKLEKQRFKWEGNCWKHDRELKKMRLQNESLKLENKRMATELTYKERGAD